MYCDHCGAENPDDATTCFACHRSLDIAAIQTSNNMPLSHGSSLPLSADLLKERYRIVARIGQGGFGSVFKAQDTRNNNQPVAIKEIDMGGLKPQEIIEATDAFNREVQLLSELKHPNLPRMHTHFTDTQHWYLVMDFIAGDTLERYLEQAQSGSNVKQGIKQADVLNIAMQLCTVLHYMHMHNPSVIFRDLKPSNVMLAPGQRVYLIDFGIARIFKPGQVKDTMAFGSPGYAAPEQYGKAQTNPRADIYSLGAILHQMLTGKDPSDTPFHFAPVRFTHPTLPVEIDQLIMQMLEMEPDKRPASMALVKQRLGAIVDGKNASRGYAGGYSGANITQGSYRGNPNYQAIHGGTSSSGQAQSMHPPQYTPAKKKKPNMSRRAAVGILGGLIVTMMICSNIGKKNNTQDDQNSSSPDQSVPTNDTLTLYGPVQYALHSAAISAVAWAPDGTAVASADADKTVQVWSPNYQNKRFFSIDPAYQQAATTVAWSPNGKSIASGSLDKKVRIWNVRKAAITVSASFPAPITAVAWSADNTRIAVGCTNNMVYVCSGTTLQTETAYQGHTDSIRALAWGDIYIASASADYTVKIWNTQKNQLAYDYIGHSNIVNAVAWSPNLLQIASASSDRTVQIWNPLTGVNSYTYAGHINNGTPTEAVNLSKTPPSQVYALAWEPDNGRHIASGGSNGMLQIWRSSDGTLIASDQSSNKSIRSIAWTSNAGSSIVCGGDDRIARVWRIE